MARFGSKWSFLWRYLIASYPLIGWLFFRCLRIIMSMKFWIVLRLRAHIMLHSRVDTVSKCISVLEYGFMCLYNYSYTYACISLVNI